jgi:hypothetical protein
MVITLEYKLACCPNKLHLFYNVEDVWIQAA